jgi:hypothetical protein
MKSSSARWDHRLVHEKLQDIQAVTIAKFHIDDRRIFVQPVLAVFTRRLPIVFVVILGRRPEMKHHFTAAAVTLIAAGLSSFILPTIKEFPDMVLKVARTLAPESNHFAR